MVVDPLTRNVSLVVVDGQIMVGDLPAVGALPHMSRVTQSVYAALLRAHVEEQGWGDVVSNQVTVVSCRTLHLACFKYNRRFGRRFAALFVFGVLVVP